MKRNKYTTILLMSILTLLSLNSCDEYLDIDPKGQRLLKTVDDYNLWLNNQKLQESAMKGLIYLSDHYDMPEITDVWDKFQDLAYNWQQQLSDEPHTNSPIWGEVYSHIYYYNAVINDVNDATGGTDEERQSLRAEALLGRSFLYLGLTNLYGKVYNEATADQDLAVPFVTSVDVTDDTPDRSTVQEMYDHIIADINEAIPYLPLDNSTNRYRGSVAAAYGVLARTYFYMGKYSLAAENAQLALDNGPNVIAMQNVEEMSELLTRSDAIYAREASGSVIIGVLPPLDFMKKFDTNDQRLPFHYSGLEDFNFESRGIVKYEWHSTIINMKFYPNWGISVAEMRLIMAEAAARAGDTTTACDQLDLIRSKRFLPENYDEFRSTDAEEVLERILQERELELPFHGVRWFDMRRLAAEGRMPTVNRYDGQGSVISTLEPNSDRYVLQIPLEVMDYNPGWEQNP